MQVKSPSRPSATDKTAQRVRKAFQCGPRKQTYRSNHQLDLPTKTVCRVFWKSLLLKAYKLQLVQALNWTTTQVIQVFLWISRETGRGWRGDMVWLVTKPHFTSKMKTTATNVLKIFIKPLNIHEIPRMICLVPLQTYIRTIGIQLFKIRCKWNNKVRYRPYWRLWDNRMRKYQHCWTARKYCTRNGTAVAAT
jgi:hypothetical protein